MHFVDPSLFYPQDKESLTDADRWRAVDAASLHGKHHTDTVLSLWTLIKYQRKCCYWEAKSISVLFSHGILFQENVNGGELTPFCFVFYL